MSVRRERPAREPRAAPAAREPRESRASAREKAANQKKAYGKAAADIDAKKPGAPAAPEPEKTSTKMSVSERMKALVDAERLEQMAAKRRTTSASQDFVERHKSRVDGQDAIRQQYEDMRPFQLRKLCEEHGIDASNAIKGELVQKLLDRATSGGTAATEAVTTPRPATRPAKPPPWCTDDLAMMKFSGLAALARELGCSKGQIDDCQDAAAPRAELAKLVLAASSSSTSLETTAAPPGDETAAGPAYAAYLAEKSTAATESATDMSAQKRAPPPMVRALCATLC